MKSNFQGQIALPKIWRLTKLAAILLMLSPLSSFAQKALDFEKGKGIIIPQKTEVSNKIIFTITKDFPSAKEGLAYFEKYNTDLMHARLNYEKQIVTVYLLVDKRPNWEVENWNKYLQKLNQK